MMRNNPATRNLGICLNTDVDSVKFKRTLRQKFTLCFSAGVAFLSLATGVFVSPAASLMVFGSFVLGFCFAHSLFGQKFQNFSRNLRKRSSMVSNNQPSSPCAICQTPTCSRPEQLESNHLHDEQFLIAAEVDEALEEFLNLTFERYIYAWHNEITDDGAFLLELKKNVRHAITVLLRRVLKIDLPKLITRKLLRAAFSHLDCCLQANQRRSGEKSNMEEAVFDYYGADLHVAMYSRTCELKYLHSLSEKVLPLLLPDKFLNCRGFHSLIQEILSSTILLSILDAVSEPDLINNLLLLFFDKTPMIHYAPYSKPKVQLLKRFVADTTRKSSTHLGENLFADPTRQAYLYPLMKFMKTDGSVGILQFCLAIDDFSARLLNPDLSEEDLKLLHQEASKLYSIYMAPNGVDKLNFDDDVVDAFKSVVEGPYQEIIKLQTTEPLYKVHECAFKLLERHVPYFCESEEYFEYLCGSRARNESQKSARPSRKATNLSTAARIGNKINRIRGVLLPTSAIDGHIEEDAADLADAGFEADEMKLGMDIDSNYGDMDDLLSVRDLSAWRVSIPRVEVQECSDICDIPNCGNVSLLDNPDEFHWVVERQYHEFYVLETKLTEFHGEFVDIHLPSKRSFVSKGLEYMEARRPAFEEFLQRLLQKPTFRGSELLFTFLSSTGDFTKSHLPDINFGRMIKNVPMKLLKEKGQHLECFLQNFVVSTEAPKPKSKLEYLDLYSYPTSLVTRKLRKSIYADNAGRRLDYSPLSPPRFKSVLQHEGICDYVMYLGLKVLKIPGWSLQFLVAILKAFGVAMELFIDTYFDSQLREALVPQRIAILIHLLRDVVFIKDASKRTEEEKQCRAQEALNKAKLFLPKMLVKIIGSERHNEGMSRLFEILQYPRLNKQLAYMLLDIVVLELFPELSCDVSASGDTMTSFEVEGKKPTITFQRDSIQ